MAKGYTRISLREREIIYKLRLERKSLNEISKQAILQLWLRENLGSLS